MIGTVPLESPPESAVGLTEKHTKDGIALAVHALECEIIGSLQCAFAERASSIRPPDRGRFALEMRIKPVPRLAIVPGADLYHWSTKTLTTRQLQLAEPLAGFRPNAGQT
ncbi:MAG: hypothetical protein ACLP7O_00900 [Terracidiphilus sp.]